MMDDHNIVKIADFGVARIIEANGNMTAETGTYRWDRAEAKGAGASWLGPMTGFVIWVRHADLGTLV